MANKTLQATPVCAILFFLSQVARAPDFIRSSIQWRRSRLINPKGWQKAAGGRNGVKTPGSGLGISASWRDARALRPLQSRRELEDVAPVVSLRSTTGYGLASRWRARLRNCPVS